MDTNAYLNTASERFRSVYGEIAAAVHKTFPMAKPNFDHGMPGFNVPITPSKKEDQRGTFDPNFLQMFLVERKSGITFHIWDPRNYYGLDAVRDEFTKLGFKVMRGCLVWNRKKEYPVERMRELIQALAK